MIDKTISIFIVYLIIISIYSCCKDGETIYVYNGVKASLYDKGASELSCNYPFKYFFTERGKIYACINLPDSLNNNPKWAKYEINFKLLNGKLKCNVWGNCCEYIDRIELISAKRY